MKDIKLKRISSELVKTINEIIMEESNDELLKSITITGSEVSSDLSYAKVYFTSLKDMDHQQLEKEMDEASKMFRKFVAEKMDLRQTPQLKFIYDESIAYGSRIESIIQTIHEND